ncbi:helix-turn-helix domain-containing protein [Sorangium sp. So ce131]|uniref:helix-turn-helix domain-containing protein n=1 Tax=Sorangium sp. So ce131 TaxID=3133282 RepID=UPI003F6246A2
MKRAFGQALAAARIAAGLTQEELGQLLDVVASSVWYWESGLMTPIASHYEQLVSLFPALKSVPRPGSRDQVKPGPAPAPRSERKPRTRSKPAAVVPIREAPCDCAELRLSCGLCRPVLARAV